MALRSVIENLGPQVTRIDFVGHSLGNIVVRRYVGQASSRPALQVDKRIGRMVMVGPPNQGSQLARLMKDSVAFELIAGVSGTQLSRNWKQLESELGTPKFPFGIIAGGQNGDQLSNPLLAGRDDFTVSVEESKLAGASDMLVLPLFHSTMMLDDRVLSGTARFLEQGYFVSEKSRRPIK